MTTRRWPAVLFCLVLAGCFPRGEGDGDQDAGQRDSGPADAGGCTPDETEACTCAGGDEGTRTCNAAGTDWGPCECDTSCTDSALTADGTLSASGVTIDYTGTEVVADVVHKLDADAAEDGCISTATFSLALPGGGCRLTVTLGPYTAPYGGVTSVVLQADSLCPGFADPDEGTYRSAPAYGGWWYLGPTEVVERQAASACLPAVAIGFPANPVPLERTSDGRALSLDLSSLSFVGDLVTTGDTGVGCIDVACAPSLHDGGDGWCIDEGTCAGGYHDGGDGACVAVGTCSPGYRDGGDGTCLATGCSSGYHDGGDGACRPLGTCSPGFRLAGDGSCVVLVPCRDGIVPRPVPLDFGTVPVSVEATRGLSLTNPAALDRCIIESFAFSAGGDPGFRFAGGEFTPRTLTAGETHILDVAFQAATAGRHTVFIQIRLEDGTSEFVRATANAVNVPMTYTPAVVDFGAWPLGCVVPDAQVCARNDGALGASVDAVRIVGTSEVTLVSGPAPPVALAPSAQACWVVGYAPAGIGVDTATLEFDIGPTGETHTVPISGEGATVVTVTDTFVQPNEPLADILWVVDDSGSMGPFQASLSAAAADLITALDTESIDYQIAVVTTSIAAGGRFELATSAERIVHRGLADPAGTLAQNVLVGTSGDAVERGMATARLAFSSPAIDSPPNSSFLRPGAHLTVAFVSDEDEQSADSAATYRAFFESKVSRAALFSASAFVVTGASGCVGTAGTKYIALANQTGGVVEPICNTSWLSAFDAIAQGFQLPTHFVLASPAESGGAVSVTVTRTDGSTYTPAGFVFDPATNAVDFLGEVPAAGETIRVTYELACP